MGIHFSPQNAILADVIPFFWDGVYHLFYLKGADEHMGWPRWQTSWGHLISPNLVDWEEVGIAIPRGCGNDPDGGACFTGSVIEYQGTFHIFYTGYYPGHPGGREQIMHATSGDLIHWKKDPRNPLLLPDSRWYKTHEDWRDPFVFRRTQGDFGMLITASLARPVGLLHRGCIGLAISKNLIDWEPQPPFYTPATHCAMECPDLFEMNGYWYLLFSCGQTEYRLANQIEGPYRVPRRPILDGGGFYFYAAKTAYDGKRRLLFGWAGDTEGGKDSSSPRWGGTLCTPRELLANADGELMVRCPAEVLAAFSRSLLDQGMYNAGKTRVGNWRIEGNRIHGSRLDGWAVHTWSIPTLTCCVQVTVVVHADYGRCGFLLRASEDLSAYYAIVLDPGRGELSIERMIPHLSPMGGAWPSQPKVLAARPVTIRPGRPIDCQVLLSDGILEVFTNRCEVLTARLCDLTDGHFGLFVQECSADFDRLVVTTL
jgi:beta-fructofuranosidase